jgi:hypothetical protein
VKNIFILFLATSHILAVSAYGECDFATGIEKLSDGRFAYSSDCHKRVGKLVEDIKDKDEQITSLTKTIDLKNIQIQVQEQRAQLWMDTSMKLEDRVNAIDRMKSTNQWLYFGLGVVTTGLAVWGAGKLR